MQIRQRWKGVTAFLASARLTATWIVRPLIVRVYIIAMTAEGNSRPLSARCYAAASI